MGRRREVERVGWGSGGSFLEGGRGTKDKEETRLRGRHFHRGDLGGQGETQAVMGSQ